MDAINRINFIIVLKAQGKERCCAIWKVVQKFHVPYNAQGMCLAGNDLVALSKSTLLHGISSVSDQSLYHFQHNTILVHRELSKHGAGGIA